METTINERIWKLVEKYGDGTPTRFAKKVGVPPATIFNLLGPLAKKEDPKNTGHIKVVRQSEPGYGVLKQIVDTFPEINLTWLITGEGDMIIEKKNSELRSVASSESMNWAQKLIDKLEEENRFLKSIIAQAGLGKSEVYQSNAVAA
jgi:hypothetical protein